MSSRKSASPSAVTYLDPMTFHGLPAFACSTKVVVGIIDTAIDYKHTDLYVNVWINQ